MIPYIIIVYKYRNEDYYSERVNTIDRSEQLPDLIISNNNYLNIKKYTL